MATSGNNLFAQTDKNIMRKKKAIGLLKIKVIKSAILLNFYKVSRPQMFLILNI